MNFSKLMITVLTFGICMSVSIQAEARPVSYPGGWTVMTHNDYDAYNTHIHYSPTAKYSTGYEVTYHREDGFQSHALKLNNLLKRWNNPESQANIYLKSGLGTAYDSSGDITDDPEVYGFTGMSIDWENRRYFLQYANNYHTAGDLGEEFHQKFHVGVAPYIGEYGDLHTWLMLRVDHNPDDEDDIVLVPHVRFFKGVYLFEVGYSDNDEIMANLIVRF